MSRYSATQNQQDNTPARSTLLFAPSPCQKSCSLHKKSNTPANVSTANHRDQSLPRHKHPAASGTRNRMVHLRRLLSLPDTPDSIPCCMELLCPHSIPKNRIRRGTYSEHCRGRAATPWICWWEQTNQARCYSLLFCTRYGRLRRHFLRLQDPGILQ